VRAVFDTNILIDFLNGWDEARHELDRFRERLISPITWMEVMAGADEETESATRSFLAGFSQIPLDPSVAEVAVELRKRHRIRLPDAIIWASARVGDCLLVTRNRRDFPADDPGLRFPYGP
jgi:predicted nucleic acid-binding protein